MLTTNPFKVLGLAEDSDDQAIRKRYLELIKQCSAERHPEEFSKIREAYERLQSVTLRVEFRLFKKGSEDSIEGVLNDLISTIDRPRFSLRNLTLINNKK